MLETDLNRAELTGRRLLAVILVLLAGLAWTPGSVRGDEGRVPRRLLERADLTGGVRVIVRLADALPSPAGVADPPGARERAASMRGAMRQRLAGTQHRLLREYEAVPFVALEAGRDALQTLASMPDVVLRVEEDRLDRPSLSESVPLIQADLVRALGFDGAGSVIAILDTGVDKTHPFLAGKVVREACFSSNSAVDSARSLCPGRVSSSTAPGSALNCSLALPGCFHGTHVAGIAAGAGATFSGVAPGARILAIQVFSRFDDPALCAGPAPCVLSYLSDQLAALEHVYSLRGALNLAAVNMSFGSGAAATPCDDDIRKALVDSLRSAGIASVAAAGNDGSATSLEAPACISSAVSVGATTKGDQVLAASSSAAFLSLLAPGGAIVSSVPGGGFGVLSGTSTATPHVSGALAILHQADSRASVSDLLAALRAGGVPVRDSRNGVVTPRVRIVAALELLAAPVARFVWELYGAVLGRPPEPSGLAGWTEFVRADCSAAGAATVSEGLFASAEFRETRALTLDGLVAVLYRGLLQREPDPGGTALWAEALRQDRIAAARDGFVSTAEFRSQVPDPSDRAAVQVLVTRFYQELLGRPPDPGGLTLWSDYLVATGDFSSLAAALLQSSEFEVQPRTLRGLVVAFYRAFLGREPDPAGLEYWEGVLVGSVLRAVEGGFLPSGEFQARLRLMCGA